MQTYSPRSTRMVKSYAPIVNGLTKILEIDKVDKTPVYVYCKETYRFYPADEFYVRNYHQNYDPKTLNVKDFRHICKSVWDQKVRNQKNGLGWKSDRELEIPPATIETFFEKADENA